MTIKRFVRMEENGDIYVYDRKLRKYIQVKSERQIGDRYFVNPMTEEEVVIHRDDIEE